MFEKNRFSRFSILLDGNKNFWVCNHIASYFSVSSQSFQNYWIVSYCVGGMDVRREEKKSYSKTERSIEKLLSRRSSQISRACLWKVSSKSLHCLLENFSTLCKSWRKLERLALVSPKETSWNNFFTIWHAHFLKDFELAHLSCEQDILQLCAWTKLYYGWSLHFAIPTLWKNQNEKRCVEVGVQTLELPIFVVRKSAKKFRSKQRKNIL